MNSLTRICSRLMFLGAVGMTTLSCTSSLQAAPEIVVWPHQETDRLHVARETTQPFYIMAYKRGVEITGATEVEITVPAQWQVWLGTQAPPAAGTATPRLKLPLKLRTTKDTASSRDYSSGNSAGNLLLLARPLPQASEANLKLRWLQGATAIAEREVALTPLQLAWQPPQATGSSITAGMWLNDPKFHTETMAQVYRGLRRSGIDYVIITREMFQQSKDVLKELGIKAIVNQWWNYHAYVPGTPPEAAYSTLRNGTIDKKRWSPTYMADGGPEFVKQVEAIADELNGMEGIYGFMLDYEPGAVGIEADYGPQSRVAFEKYLGKAVSSWPADVLPKGQHEEAWINFRVDQSEAYVGWFQKIMRERAPQVKLSVSTSGATLTAADPNRRLAVTDITQLSNVTDTVHPQLYSWTSQLPAQLERFNDKFKLGQTTVAGSKNGVYTAVGSLAGRNALAKPEYLRTQILNWWLHGARGFETWQYFYGVDGRYMAMTNELAALITSAGSHTQPTDEVILTVASTEAMPVLARKSADGKTAWVGVFNLGPKAIEIPIQPSANWSLTAGEKTSVRIEPWQAHWVKCIAR
jgi:hypothetical protein